MSAPQLMSLRTPTQRIARRGFLLYLARLRSQWLVGVDLGLKGCLGNECKNGPDNWGV